MPCNDDKAKDAKIAQYQTPWVFNILTVRLLDAKGVFRRERFSADFGAEEAARLCALQRR